MKSYEMSERLRGIGVPAGHSREWSRLVACADAGLSAELLAALEEASEEKRYVIISLACEGPEKGRGILGVGGWVSEEAARFIRFVIAVADVAARVREAKKGTSLEQWDRETFIMMIRHCYTTVGADDQEMTEGLRQLSRATLVCCAANGPWTGFNENAPYFAEHFDALEPYIEFLIRSRDTTHSQLNMLLATQPILPLVEGML